MQAEYRNKLQPVVLELLDKIEMSSGLSVTVEEQPDGVALAAAIGQLTVRVETTRARIFLTGPFTSEAVFHELQHVHRYWVEGVPQACAKSPAAPDNVEIMNTIENKLEHAVIVPREIAVFPDRSSYWDSVLLANWNGYSSLTDPWPRKMNGYLGLLTTQAFATDKALIELASQKLSEVGLLEGATRFVAEVLPHLESNKKHAVRVADAHIGFFGAVVLGHVRPNATAPVFENIG